MMGRKFGRGGLNRELSQVMESCGKELTTADDIVNDLRSRYGKYARMTRQVLLLKVRQILNERSNEKRVKEEEDDEEIDENEEKLSQSHLRKRKKERPASCEDSGDGSTSEDAIYSEKMSPRFDLINDNLRDNYAKMNNKKPIVEVETVSKKSRKMVTMGGSPSVSPRFDLINDSLRDNYAKIVEVETVSNKSRKMATMGGSPSVSELKMEGEKGSTMKKFKDFGGIKKILDELDKTVLFPIVNPLPFQTMRVKPPSGILFHGPPGCGKTMLANAIANEAGVPFYPINATDLVSGVSGASEENIRELFSKAYRTAPSIVFIDEIDAIGSKRENQQREMEKRIVTQLLTCMDGPASRDGGYVLVIGATNRPDALDPALRRSGRFEREIALTAPDEDARAEILSVMVQNIGHRLQGPFDKNKIARLTAGFVGADLEGLVYMAGSLAISRVADSRKAALSGNGEDDDRAWLWKPWLEEDLEKLYVKMSDFEEAVSVFQGSLTREGFSKVPDVKWEDVGGLDLAKDELNSNIIRAIQSPDVFKSFGQDLETGFLLYGPPGCGKTLIAKAVANEAGANFIYIKGSELVSKYVGESEGNIRALFQRAHKCSPCVIFFDELDAITTSRGKDGTWAVGVVNQLLSELDGGERRNVFVIGATNRPDVLDNALLRPGRFGHLAYVPLPNADQRVSILNAIIAKKKRIDPSVHLDSIANMCQDFTGADLANLVDKAIHLVIDEIFRSQDDVTKTVKMTHFEQALSLVSPSVTKQQIKHYEELSKELQGCTVRNIQQPEIPIGSSFAFQ